MYCACDYGCVSISHVKTKVSTLLAWLHLVHTHAPALGSIVLCKCSISSYLNSLRSSRHFTFSFPWPRVFFLLFCPFLCCLFVLFCFLGFFWVFLFCFIVCFLGADSSFMSW